MYRQSKRESFLRKQRLGFAIVIAVYVSPNLLFTLCHGAVNQSQVLLNINPYLDLDAYQSYRQFKKDVRELAKQTKEEINGEDLKGSETSVYVESDKGGDLNGIEGILAIVRENVWPYIRIPGVQPALLKSNSKPFTSILGTLYKTGERDYNTKVRNLIFSKNWIKIGLTLSNLKTELKQTYFDNGEKATAYINSRLKARFGGDLPDFLEYPTPTHTEAVIVNVKEEEGQWDGLTQYAGFFPESNMEMFELRGTFDYQIAEGEHFVYVPFRNTNLRLKIIIPGDSNNNTTHGSTQPPGYYLPPPPGFKDEGTLLGSCPLRLVLPIKSYVSRTSLETPSVSECLRDSNFGRCLAFTHTLSHTTFSPTGFKSVALAGGIVVNPGDYYRNANRRSQYAFTRWSGSNGNNIDFLSNFRNLKSWLYKSPFFRNNGQSQTLLRRQGGVGDNEKTIVAKNGIQWEIESVL